MSPFASTPEPPYTAVIFTVVRGADATGYSAMATGLGSLVKEQPGFLGVESADGDGGVEITVSYWSTPDHALAWKAVAEHAEAQRRGRAQWYLGYRVRGPRTVERDYAQS